MKRFLFFVYSGLALAARRFGLFAGRVVLFAGCLFLFAGCAEKKEPAGSAEGSFQVFFLDSEGCGVVSEAYEPEKKAGVELITELLGKMRFPSEKEHTSALEETVSLPEISIGGNGLVTLLFDESYAGVLGVREVLMRAAIVKTICQCEEIDSVEIYVAGQPLLNAQNTPVGIMRPENFLDSPGMSTEVTRSFSAILYYTNSEGNVLLASSMVLSLNGNESEEMAILRRLIAGPTEVGVFPVLSENVQVNSVSTKDGVCTVDFNAAFLEKLPGVSEEVLIYSVVDSLANLPNVYMVQFLIDGEVHRIFQKMDLSLSYERNLNIVENE